MAQTKDPVNAEDTASVLAGIEGQSVRTGAPLSGVFQVPGDKSMSHRAILFGALARGTTTVTGLLEGEDVLRSAAVMRALGAEIECDRTKTPNEWTITGPIARGSEGAPISCYFGNAGTGVRLAMGLVAGRGRAAWFDGDASLRSRPMRRILDPLAQMGVVAGDEEGRLPVVMEANSGLNAIDYRLPVASAQIKSAILLAGLGAQGTTRIEEPVRSRDHTENMLKAFGVQLTIDEMEEGGRVLSLEGGQQLTAAQIEVPGDPSSAAFPIAVALIVPGSDITLPGIMMNPLRTGLFETLLEMGADLTFSNERVAGGEQIADIRVRHRPLNGVSVPAARAPAMIDEYPILAVIAAFAKGQTRMEGIGEKRVKESDRIHAMEIGLKDNGVRVESGPDWLSVSGSVDEGGTVGGGARVATYHDHRIAMSFLCLGLGARAPVRVDDMSMIATSFPEFVTKMDGIGASIVAR